MKLNVLRISPNAKMPELAHYGEDLGYDVFAAEEVEIAPGEQKMVDLGFAYEIDPLCIGGVEFKIGLLAKQPSGLAKKRRLMPMAGVIDAGYRESIKVLLYNYGDSIQHICIKDKIAQLAPTLVLTSNIEEVFVLSESSRGKNGWGSNHKDDK